MRPRKKVVLICGDDEKIARLAYVITVRGNYAVTRLSVGDLGNLLGVPTPDAVVVVHPMPAGWWASDIITRVKSLQPDTKTMEVSGLTSQETNADAFLPKDADSPAEILDRLRILVARKRGPKKMVRECVAA